MVTISPIASFLRQKGAKAVNHNKYFSRTLQRPMQECAFIGKDGNYIGTLRRSATQWIKGHAYHQNYIETGNMGQQRDFYIQYAKIIGKNGEKDKFIPEAIHKEFTIRDQNGNFTREIRERTVSSKLKPIGENTNDKYKIYEALEPIKYEEKIISSGPIQNI